MKNLLPLQRKDFIGLFTVMKGLPVTIRLLDPPLHEFLPHTEEDVEAVAAATGLDAAKLMRRAKELHETNPMLGHRGCRLGVTYPEIYEMQVRAIIAAALTAQKNGVAVKPEIMIPLIATKREMEIFNAMSRRVADELIAKSGQKLAYMVGTMIELPRAALAAGEIASEAEFFSFGTNDLTQMTFGYSRDDIASFLPVYLEKKILKVDPFQVLDQNGVGQLIEMAVDKGRSVRPDLKCGICGEHGGEPSSVKFCAKVGMNYASCSPFRVPIARLAAAQAAVEE